MKGHLSAGVLTIQNLAIPSRIHGKLQHNRNMIYKKTGIKDLSLQYCSVFRYSNVLFHGARIKCTG